MYKIIFILAVNLIAFSLFSQTSVSGGIYQNTTWTTAGSPYIITGSIVVFPGNTLTIQPGVEIKIDNQVNNTIYIETRGTINCVGTDLLPIKIYTIYDTTSTVGWQGFVCTSSQGGVLNADRFHISNAFNPFAYETPLNNYQYTNCKFSHCSQAISVANSVELINCQFIDNEVGVFGWSYFTIQNCFFKDNTTSIQAYPTAFLMTNTNFVDNQIGVSFAANVFDSMFIEDCQFLNNGLALNYPNKGKVQNCLFSDNTTAIQSAYYCEIFNNEFMYNELAIEACVNALVHDNQINNNKGGLRISNVSTVQDSPQIYDNEICSNIIFNVDNNTNMNYSLLSNCFCGLDSSTIEIYLIDGYDDIIKGLINYTIYDTTCTSILGTVQKFVAQGAGIDPTSSSTLSYTNPVSDYLKIFQETAIDQLSIYNTNGQHFFIVATSPNVFDLRFLQAGIYFVKVAQENSTTNIFKVIKQ
jgi:hypothetical protein